MGLGPVLKSTRDEYRNRLQELRLRALISTQEALAQKTGIDRRTISLLENNRIFLSAVHALRLAEALGCLVDDLYEKKSVADG